MPKTSPPSGRRREVSGRCREEGRGVERHPERHREASGSHRVAFGEAPRVTLDPLPPPHGAFPSSSRRPLLSSWTLAPNLTPPLGFGYPSRGGGLLASLPVNRTMSPSEETPEVSHREAARTPPPRRLPVIRATSLAVRESHPPNHAGRSWGNMCPAPSTRTSSPQARGQVAPRPAKDQQEDRF